MYRETKYGAKLRDNKEYKVCRDIISRGHCSVRERDKKVFEEAFDPFFSACACLCEIHVFVKISFRSTRMEREKRAM